MKIRLRAIKNKRSRIYVTACLYGLLFLHRFKHARPIDMLLPVTVAQSGAMIIFLPFHNFIGMGISSLIICAWAILPGLMKNYNSSQLG